MEMVIEEATTTTTKQGKANEMKTKQKTIGLRREVCSACSSIYPLSGYATAHTHTHTDRHMFVTVFGGGGAGAGAALSLREALK